MDRSFKECNRHEKRPLEDDILRICETCGRQFYACDLCRNSRNIDVPLNICINPCAPAMKTLKPYLDKKDIEISELQTRLKRSEDTLKANEELKRQLQFHKKSNDEHSNDKQQIKAELNELKYQHEKLNNDHQILNEEMQPRKELSSNMKTLLSTNEYSDCVIQCGSNKYQAHKCILTSRSPVLKKLVNEAVKNQKSGSTLTVEIKDIKPENMPFLLNYLYTGEAENGLNEQNISDVAKMADTLQLKTLKESCLLYKEKKMNRDTLVSVLIDANNAGNERLKRKCMKIMKKENIDLLQAKEWKEYKNEKPKEALALYEAYVKEQSIQDLDSRKHSCLSPMTLSRKENLENFNRNNKRVSSPMFTRKSKTKGELIKSTSQDSLSNVNSQYPKLYQINPKKSDLMSPSEINLMHELSKSAHTRAHESSNTNTSFRKQNTIGYLPSRIKKDQQITKLYQISPRKDQKLNNSLKR